MNCFRVLLVISLKAFVDIIFHHQFDFVISVSDEREKERERDSFNAKIFTRQVTHFNHS
jgi:hypothetical protein